MLRQDRQGCQQEDGKVDSSEVVEVQEKQNEDGAEELDRNSEEITRQTRHPKDRVPRRLELRHLPLTLTAEPRPQPP